MAGSGGVPDEPRGRIGCQCGVPDEPRGRMGCLIAAQVVGIVVIKQIVGIVVIKNNYPDLLSFN